MDGGEEDLVIGVSSDTVLDAGLQGGGVGHKWQVLEGTESSKKGY